MGLIRRRMPPGSRPQRGDPSRNQHEVGLVWISRRQGDLDAGFEFLDAHGDLEEAAAQGFEACPPPG